MPGFSVGWVYLRYGSRVEAGNNLILEEIHHPAQVIPLRMAPLVFISTVISHLFGASVGREGTAVQMGASIADQFTALLRLNNNGRRIVLLTGISAGFSSVFGTPLAAALIRAGGAGDRSDGLSGRSCPACFAAIVANQVGLMWGVQHTHYLVTSIPALSAWTLLAVILAWMLLWPGRPPLRRYNASAE